MSRFPSILPLLMILSLLLASCGMTSRLGKGGEEGGNAGTSGSVRAGTMIEDGIASWYGPNFHGKLTANGEQYDMYGLTAAHRTLPFNTLVRVENKNNGKSVTVRINDRGPYAKNRIIDLSRRAAGEIDMLGPGTAPVELFLVEGDLSSDRATALNRPTYTVQLGSYKGEQQAFELSRKIEGARVEEVEVDGETVYRVYYGMFIDPREAERKQDELSARGIESFVKQLEN